MKNRYKERGITLIALIITIMVLIILVAVTVIAVVDSNMLGISIKSTEDYSKAQIVESKELDETVGLLEETVSNIVSLVGETPKEEEPEEPEKPEETIKTIYAKLYNDGTFMLSSSDYVDEEEEHIRTMEI